MMTFLLFILVLFTIILMVLRFKQNRDVKFLLVSIVTFGIVVAFTSLLPMFRTVTLLYVTHLVLLIFSWGTLFWFLMKGKLYWWGLFLPTVTVILFIVIEAIVGAGGY
jgi:presenilin-like A22 family membrane protease